MSQGKDNARLKSYKNKSLNTDEMRRRREEEGLQLRKQKKDEQVSESKGLVAIRHRPLEVWDYFLSLVFGGRLEPEKGLLCYYKSENVYLNNNSVLAV